MPSACAAATDKAVPLKLYATKPVKLAWPADNPTLALNAAAFIAVFATPDALPIAAGGTSKIVSSKMFEANTVMVSSHSADAFFSD